jgi:hypothetical protein
MTLTSEITNRLDFNQCWACGHDISASFSKELWRRTSLNFVSKFFNLCVSRIVDKERNMKHQSKSHPFLSIIGGAILILALSFSISVTAYGQDGLVEPTPVDSSDAVRAVVREDNGNVVIGSMSMATESLVFDPDQNLAGAPGGGMLVTMEDSPIPLMMTFDHGFGGSAWAVYANSILDVSELPESREQLGIAVVYTPDGVARAFIKLNLHDLDEVFISSDYIAFPSDIRTTEADGPFANLTFNAVPSVNGTLIVFRNDEEIARADLAEGKPFTFPLNQTQTKDDVIEWRVEETEGEAVYSGILGFPLRGATENLVDYQVSIGDT